MNAPIVYLGKKTAYIPGNKATNEPHLGVVIGEMQTLLVDAGSSIAHFQRVYTTLEQAGIEPPTAIVCTHYHWDHVFAAGYYEAVLYAQHVTAAKLEQMHTWRFDDTHLQMLKSQGHFSAWSAQMIADHVPARSKLVVKQADVVFNEGYNFQLGGVNAEAIHVGGSHTSDSSIVYVPSDKVLFLGDSLYSSRGVYDLEMLWPLIAAIQELDVETALLSHREPFTRQQFQHYLALFTSLAIFVGESDQHATTHRRFEKMYGRKPTPDEFYLLRGFVGANIAKREQRESESQK